MRGSPERKFPLGRHLWNTPGGIDGKPGGCIQVQTWPPPGSLWVFIEFISLSLLTINDAGGGVGTERRLLTTDRCFICVAPLPTCIFSVWMWTQTSWFSRCATVLVCGVGCRACCDHGWSYFSYATHPTCWICGAKDEIRDSIHYCSRRREHLRAIAIQIAAVTAFSEA